MKPNVLLLILLGANSNIFLISTVWKCHFKCTNKEDR